MSRQVQIRRGTTAQHAAFTGAQGELSYNTTTKRLHTHDGSTVGGAVHALLAEMQAADAAAQAAAQAAAEATAAAALAARVAILAGTGGAATVGNLDSAGNYNATDLEGALTEIADTSTYVNLFRFFTPAQITDYQARTAQTNYAAALDLTTAIQNAIYTTYAAGRNLYCPAGAAKITATLEIPTNTALYQDQPDTWEMIGQGAAQAFVQSGYKGTVFLANTDITIFRYHQRRAQPTGGGLWSVKRIRFQQNLSTAASTVVVLDNLIDGCEFAWNQIYTAGTGNGVDVTYTIKGEFHHNFVANRDWLAGSASAVGIGINFPVIVGSGLLSVKKNTCRGFLWGYQFGGAGFNPVDALIEQNECSMCKNGVWVKTGTSNMKLHKPYFEGITGTCVQDDGSQTVVDGGQFYLGFAIGIDGSNGGSLYGNTYINNYLETSGSQPCTLIKVVSGGPMKNIYGNTMLFSTSGGVVPGVVGLDISGPTARINHHSNAYNPRGRWIGGAGTMKINDTTTGGAFGLGTANDVDLEAPALRRGAISLALGSAALTQADVTANVLAVGEFSYYLVSATGAATVLALDAKNYRHGQRITFRTTTANMTFSNGAQMKLAGAASFTGPGTIEFQMEQSGSTTFAYEVGRTVF